MPLHPSAEAILPLFKDAGLDLGPDTTPAQARAKMNSSVGVMPTYPLFAVDALKDDPPAPEA